MDVSLPLIATAVCPEPVIALNAYSGRASQDCDAAIGFGLM